MHCFPFTVSFRLKIATWIIINGSFNIHYGNTIKLFKYMFMFMFICIKCIYYY